MVPFTIGRAASVFRERVNGGHWVVDDDLLAGPSPSQLRRWRSVAVVHNPRLDAGPENGLAALHTISMPSSADVRLESVRTVWKRLPRERIDIPNLRVGVIWRYQMVRIAALLQPNCSQLQQSADSPPMTDRVHAVKPIFRNLNFSRN